jgi:hypothetical protein
MKYHNLSTLSHETALLYKLDFPLRFELYPALRILRSPEEEYESKIYTYRAHFHIAHPDLNLRRNIPLEYGENSPPADMTVL